MARPLIGTVLLTLLAVSPALGADEDLTQIAVPYGDLELHSAAGQSELYARIANSASTLCRPRWMRIPPDSEFTAHYREVIYHACVGRLTNRALDKIDGAPEAQGVASN